MLLRTLYEKAIKHLEAGELDEAEETLQTYVRENPTDAMAHNKLGVVFVNRLNRDEAKRCFEEALKHDAYLIHALNNLGNIAREEGELTLAIEYYQKAIRINPDYPLPHNNLGVVYKQQNRYRDFIREIKIAKRLEHREVIYSKDKHTFRNWLTNFCSKSNK